MDYFRGEMKKGKMCFENLQVMYKFYKIIT